LFAKNEPYLRTLFDIHWHRPFLDYSLDWRTPLFSLGGNILYGFGIQPGFKANLAPLNGLATLVEPTLRLATSYALFYIAMGILLWTIGLAAGMRPVARVIFAGSTGLIVTIPFGLGYLLPILPRFLYMSQAMLTNYWEEVSILSLTAAFLFFGVGQRQTAIANALNGVGFAFACFILLLAYPGAAVFCVPVIVLYCGAFLATAETARELFWKIAAGLVVLAIMLAAHLPEFFDNLYSLSLASYFRDRTMEAGTPPPMLLKNSTMVGVFSYDWRVPILWLISIGTAIFFIAQRHRGMRRIAIAMLVCEAGVFVLGAIGAYTRIPLSLYYMDQLHAPIIIGFFVLPLMIAAAVICDRADSMIRGILARTRDSGIASHALVLRAPLVLLLVLAYSIFVVPVEPETGNSSYPPEQPPSVQMMAKEVALAAGKPFGGRVYTLVRQGFPAATPEETMAPLWTAILNTLENHYGRYTGNDHWMDLLSLNIPVLGEYGEWTTPIEYAFLRKFFANKDDQFAKELFILRAFDERVARMMGVRYVVTDEPSVAGGTLVYQQMAADVPLRIFRIDGVNLGQYSPTHARRISTATEALDVIGSADFDPRRDVLVEENLPDDLVSGRLQSLTVELGPTLHVDAESEGESLLVLPFEWSNCLHLEAKGGTLARLIPVNLQQTGLLFEHRADVSISYGYGPFDHPGCRGDDLARTERLDVHSAL
jgi:hypothetical protein